MQLQIILTSLTKLLSVPSSTNRVSATSEDDATSTVYLNQRFHYTERDPKPTKLMLLKM